jgi:hypothetical protein
MAADDCRVWPEWSATWIALAAYPKTRILNRSVRRMGRTTTIWCPRTCSNT